MLVTVLLVVYNSEEYIETCIKSILSQSFQDFELLIIDDGSKDETVNLIRRQKDRRIRLFCNSHNFILSLNLGLKESRGKYIARIDGDDIMNIDRLKKQVEIMERNENLTVCSSWAKCFGLCDINIDTYNGFVENALYDMIIGNIVLNPTSMIRKDFIRKNNIVYKNYPYAEDYKFWSDIVINNGNFWVIPEYLLYYRCSENQVSHRKKNIQKETAIQIQKEHIAHIIGNKREILHLYKKMFQFYEKKILSFDTLCKTIYEVLTSKRQ